MPDNFPILAVSLDDQKVCSIIRHEVPVEKRLVVELARAGQLLCFIDSRGDIRSYDLSSIYEEGERFVHLSIRVGLALAVQPDALLTKDGQSPEQIFKTPDGKGIRFQPFYLPESTGNPSDLVGCGLFKRGLHFPGTITPGNVSFLCICDHCNKSFRLQSFHAGFSALSFLYCSRGPHTLATSSFMEDAPPVIGKANAESVERFEQTLPPCRECGGEFRYMNPLRCPRCQAAYIDFQRHPEAREQEYYGNYLYGDTLQSWPR